MFKFPSFFFKEKKNMCEKKCWIFKNMYLLFKVNDIVMKVANSISKILFWEWMCEVLKHFCVMGHVTKAYSPQKKGLVWIEPQLIDTKSHHIYHHIMGSTCCESAWHVVSIAKHLVSSFNQMGHDLRISKIGLHGKIMWIEVMLLSFDPWTFPR